MTLNPHHCAASPTKRHAVATTDRMCGTCLYCGLGVERINEQSSWWYVVEPSTREDA